MKDLESISLISSGFSWFLMVLERSESLGTLDIEDLERSGASGPWIPSF